MTQHTPAEHRGAHCSTPAPKSSVAKQWIKEELAQKKENINLQQVNILN